MSKPIEIDIGIGKVTIHDDYLVNVMHEGITVSVKSNKILIELAELYFKNKPFVYITHRKNSYAVDTAIYKETAKIKNLIGFSVVSKKGMALTNASIEKMFFSKPFEIFEELDDAIKWSKKLCKAYLKNSKN